MCAAVYRQRHLVRAMEVTAGLAESNGSLLPGLWRDSLQVTCWLTQGLKNPFCVPTDDLLRAKDDLLSEGGQSLSSLTEQASDKACNQTGTHFHCYNLPKHLYLVICIFCFTVSACYSMVGLIKTDLSDRDVRLD